jgi:hypothetical protein
MNGLGQSAPLRSGLEKIERLIAVCRLRFPTASANLCHWRDGGGRPLILPASAFQTERSLLDHLRDSHRTKLLSGTNRRLISGEVAPGQGTVERELTDIVTAPSFTDLFFSLGEFTVRSRVQTAVERGNDQLVLRFNRWCVEVTAEYDWDPARWALIPGVGRVSSEERFALHRSGHGRSFHIRSELATITDPEITAPARLPAGNY